MVNHENERRRVVAAEPASYTKITAPMSPATHSVYCRDGEVTCFIVDVVFACVNRKFDNFLIQSIMYHGGFDGPISAEQVW